MQTNRNQETRRNQGWQSILFCFLLFVGVGVFAGQVETFTLINASTNSDIQTLNNGATIDLATTGSSLAIRANISGTATKVNFVLSGTQSHAQSEGVAPYALHGDNSGDYNSWTPAVGSYTLKADCDGAGVKTINFTVTNTGTPPPPPPPPAAGVYLEKNGLVVMEMENTASSLIDAGDPTKKWVKETTLSGYTGTGYLKAVGNSYISGPAKCPVEFQFKINKAGNYYFLLHCAKEKVDDRTDVANDCFIRVEGDYTAGTGTSAANLDDLKKDTKYYGGNIDAFAWAAGNNLDAHEKKWRPIYNFKAGQTYKLVVSQRSGRFKINRIVYRHATTAESTAKNLSTPESDKSTGNDDGDGFPHSANGTVSGELKKWHRVTIGFDGPSTSEIATPNPFTNYRLDVTFKNGTTTYVVPGYYAADGNGANTSATSGKVWLVHFAPDKTGTWSWTASFKSGSNVAQNGGGSSAGYMDGKTGTFDIAATDKTGRDLRGKGRLKYVNKHHLQFAETGEYFMKQGPDAPENFLAYEDFDNTPDNGGRRKSWSAHAGDYGSGDPTWKGGKGTEIIGAVNYLAAKGLNAFSFLTMNINGDDKNVFPYISDAAANRQRMDCSKLAQWEVVLEHATRKGMYLHFKTQETENDQLLDGGALSNERKLYYRELIARFGHHLALNWNLGEENTNTDAQRKAFAQFFWDNDPYRHNIVIHSYPNQDDSVYGPMLGSNSRLTGTSLQLSNSAFTDVFGRVKEWVDKSKSAGKPWVVAVDEPGDASHALRPVGDTGNSWEDGRKNALWGTIMAGGAGDEWYFGYQHAHSDLTCQDFRSRDGFWNYCRYAIEFFENNNVPFQDMSNSGLSSNTSSWCLDKDGDVYVVYLKSGGTTNLNLGGQSGTFTVKWYDPRNGGSLKNGSVTSVNGGGSRALGNAPSNTDKDWVILVTASGPVTKYALTVNSGTGSGDYASGASVPIAANAPASGKVFDAWTGDTGYVVDVNASSTTVNMPAKAVTVTATYKDAPPFTGLAINCGGGAYTAGDGTKYVADIHFNGGSTYSTSAAISGTTDDTLYKSERWIDGTLSYAIPVPNGDYKATLQFAEVYQTSAGTRVFDVKVEGGLKVDNLDIFAEVGKDAAYDVTVTVTVSDGELNIDLEKQTNNPKISAIRVVPDDGGPNEAPVAQDQSVTTNEDTAKGITLKATDGDGDGLNYSVVKQPTNGKLTGTPPNVIYMPNANYNGSDSFTFKANDGKTDSNTATVTITINPVNDKPIAISNSYTTNEDTDLNVSAPGVLGNDSDVDEDTLTAILVDNVTSGSLTLNSDGSFTYIPGPDFNGNDSFTYVANDGKVNSTKATVTIEVKPVNDPPTADGQSVTAAAGTPKAIVLTADDPDGDSLTFSIVDSPASGSISGTLPNITYTATAGYSGPDSFTFRVNDGKVNSTKATVSITVTNDNSAPLAGNMSVNVGKNKTRVFNLDTMDADGDALTCTVVTPPEHGTLTISGTEATYKPDKNYEGADNFTFKANDGMEDSNIATVQLNIAKGKVDYSYLMFAASDDDGGCNMGSGNGAPIAWYLPLILAGMLVQIIRVRIRKKEVTLDTK